jgi:hypothetical protein
MQLSRNASILDWRIVWVTKNCCFMAGLIHHRNNIRIEIAHLTFNRRYMDFSSASYSQTNRTESAAVAQGWQPYGLHAPTVQKYWEPQLPERLWACTGRASPFFSNWSDISVLYSTSTVCQCHRNLTVTIPCTAKSPHAYKQVKNDLWAQNRSRVWHVGSYSQAPLLYSMPYKKDTETKFTVWELIHISHGVGREGTADPFPLQEQCTQNRTSFALLYKALSHFCETKK